MQINLRNRKFEVAPASHEEFWKLVSSGAWESDTFAIFDRFLDREHSYLDIGTWIGPTVLYGCQISKSVYGLEPDPIAHAEILNNVALNRPLTDNVRLFNACIARQSGEVLLGSRGEGGDSTSSLLFAKKRTHWKVKAYAFEDFIHENRVTDCNFIKMDIEGGEYQIIPTMTRYLKAQRPTMHLSLHPCYLKFRPLGVVGRLLARWWGTLKILRGLGFYKHIYDHSGAKLTAARLLWLCRAKISMDIVVTDLEWQVSRAL